MFEFIVIIWYALTLARPGKAVKEHRKREKSQRKREEKQKKEQEKLQNKLQKQAAKNHN